MPIRVEGPDGYTIEFPDGTEPTVMQDAMRKHFGFQEPAPGGGGLGEIANQGLQGFNRGFDATLNLPGSLLNLGAKGINYGAEKLGYEAPLPDEPFKPVPVATLPGMLAGTIEEPTTAAGRIAGSVGEAVGGTVLPSGGLLYAGKSLVGPAATAIAGPASATSAAARGLAQRAAANPASSVYNDAVSSVGAGLGIGTAREADLGPGGEFVAGLAGGIAAPTAVNTAMRVGGGLKEGARFANRQVQRAINPTQAAFDDVADKMIEAKVTPEQARIDLVPSPSPNFLARGIHEPEIADMISRSYAGDSNRDIAAAYGIAEATVGRYLQHYSNQQPLPRNLIDVAKGLRGEGGAKPLADQGRTAMALGGDAESAKRLTDRQFEQPGRVADTIQQSAIGGRNYDDEVTRLGTTAKTEEVDAYNLVRRNANPINLKPVIGTMRRRSVVRGGTIAEQMNKAADLFFEAELREPPQSPATGLRITEARERMEQAIAKGRPYEEIAKLRRRFRVAEQQDEFSRASKNEKVGQPITSVDKFLDQRRELDQMIENSKNAMGQATPLTDELSKFRTRINIAARANNRDLTAADLKFSENRTSERLLSDGASLGKTLNQRSRQSIRDFRKMTPTQQEIFRVGFERQMADDALRVTRGNGAARQFNTDGFTEIVEELYPSSAGKAVAQRGQRLLNNLKNEAISTDTINDVMRGSRTAPLANAMEGEKDLAKAAANGLTGKFWKAAGDLSNYLARQIGEKAAAERLKILTTTEPDEMFPMLVRLEKSAKSADERQKWAQLIREFRRSRLSPAQIAETAHIAAGDAGGERRNPPLEVTIRPRP